MHEGILYPLIIALLTLPGWLAYNHPGQYKKYFQSCSGPYKFIWALAVFSVFSYSAGLTTASELAKESPEVLKKITAADDKIGTTILWIVGGGTIVSLYFSFLFESVTKWKNSKDD